MLFNKHIWKYYKKYAFFFLLGIASLIFVDWVQLLIPDYFGKIIALLNENDPAINLTKEVGTIALKTLGVAAAMMAGRILFRYTIFYASHHMECDLRREMLQKAERLSVYYYHEHPVGTVMNWFTTDIDTIEEYFGWGTVMLVDGVFLSALVIIKMFIRNPQFATIVLLPVLLIIVWGVLVEKFMDKAWTNRQKIFDELYDYVQESFTGIRVIKAFVKERQQLRAFSKIAKANQDENVKFTKIHAAFDLIIEVLIAIIFSAMLALGVVFSFKTHRALTNPSLYSLPSIFGHEFELTYDELTVFVLYFNNLIWPLIALGQIMSMRARSKASLKRIAIFLEAEEEIHDGPDAIDLVNAKGSIEFKDFTFTYPDNPNGEPYLKNISIKIEAGESIGVVGRIGSGKTTFVNSLLRLYNVKKGSIFIDDIDLMDIKIKSLRNSIAYVPQDNFLFADTIYNNIAFCDQSLSQEKVEDAAKFACVHDDIELFPDKYETVTGERGVTLSGGQKQRVSIARAFIKDAPILIFDDSVSAVDVKTEETILKNIKEARNGKTTLVVASRISTVSHLDKIIVLKDGMIEAYGPHSELVKTSPTYQKMVYLQKLEEEVKGGN